MTVLFFLIVAAGIGVSWEHIKRRLPPSLRSLTTFLPAAVVPPGERLLRAARRLE